MKFNKSVHLFKNEWMDFILFKSWMNLSYTCFKDFNVYMYFYLLQIVPYNKHYGKYTFSEIPKSNETEWNY